MALSREPRNVKKMKTIRRAEFALKQKLDRIDWEEDVLQPEIMEFQGKAQLPEIPSESIVSVEYVTVVPEAKRAPRPGK